MKYLQISFHGQTYQNGDLISPYDLTNPPTINFDWNPKKLYTLIMIDRDSPYPNNPYYKYWLHWLIVNSKDVSIPYAPPAPPKDSGIHRYYLLLFEQLDEIKPSVIYQRTNFHPTEFIFKNNLILKASFYFRAQYRPIF